MCTNKPHFSLPMSSEKVIEERRIDLANNVQARIQNPLYGIPRDKLLTQVEEFAREKDLLDVVDLLKKGALLAQTPRDFENIPELDEEDKEVIRKETTRILLLWSSYTPILTTFSLQTAGPSLALST